MRESIFKFGPLQSVGKLLHLTYTSGPQAHGGMFEPQLHNTIC